MGKEIQFRIPQNMIITNDNPVYSENEDIFDKFFFLRSKIVTDGFGEIINYANINGRTIIDFAIAGHAKACSVYYTREFLMALCFLRNGFEPEYVIRINKLFIRYISSGRTDIIDPITYLSDKYCKNNVIELMRCGLSYDDALWACVNRFSSTEERSNIRNAIRALQNARSEYNDAQLEDMIYVLFDMDRFEEVFCTVMTDKFEYVRSFEKRGYDAISRVMCRVIERMDPREIRYIIRKYLRELKYLGITGRFELDCYFTRNFINLREAYNDVKDNI